MPRSALMPALLWAGLLALSSTTWADPTPPARPTQPATRVAPGTRSDPVETRILALLSERYPGMIGLLSALVDQNSGSGNGPGIAAVLDRVETELAPLGLEVVRIPRDPAGGPHRVFRRAGKGPRLVLVGHADTIFESDHAFQSFRREEDTAIGPGVRDMKGGLVVLIHALRALEDAGALAGRAFSIVVNGDEETGSLSSRPVIEAEARGAMAGLVFEGNARGQLTTSRGGLGQGKFRISGMAAHIASRQVAVDANQELAEKMLRLLALNDPSRGVIVNVAPVAGGFKRNQVSDLATGELDLRFPTREAGDRLVREVEAILSTPWVRNPRLDRATRTEFELLLHRPPFPETQAIRQLAGIFQQAARDLGHPTGSAHSSGGSDQNLVAALGVPCIDSLGVTGSGAHTEYERAELPSLLSGAGIAALGMHRLWREGRLGADAE